MRNRLVALSTAAAVIAAAACGSDTTTPPVSKIVKFTANLTPGGEVGANITSSGTGVFNATLDTSTNVFTWTFSFQGLTSNVKMGHIHAPYVLGGTAPSAGVALNFDPATAGTSGATNMKFDGLLAATSGSGGGTIVLSGTQILSTNSGVSADSLRKLILAGNAYVNIHSVTYGGGEIRAQITRAP
jgi:hypothetical protein